MTSPGFGDRELATILAGLRYWQREGWRSVGHEHDVASNGGTLVPLSDTEIDLLCERLNTGASLEAKTSERNAGVVSEMTPELKDDALDEVYDFAFRTLQRFGRYPDESSAEEFIQAIGNYLGEPTAVAEDRPAGEAHERMSHDF